MLSPVILSSFLLLLLINPTNQTKYTISTVQCLDRKKLILVSTCGVILHNFYRQGDKDLIFYNTTTFLLVNDEYSFVDIFHNAEY